MAASSCPAHRLALTLKIWRRALALYVAHIMTSIVTLAIFAGGALYFGRQDLIGEINIRPFVEQTEQGIVAMVLLGHQLGYNNILSMYAVLFLMLPGILWLNGISSRLLLVFSALLWLVAGVFKLVPSNFLDEGYWFLNPWSWQFLFVIGIVSMTAIRQGAVLPRRPLLIAIAAIYLVVSALWVLFSWWNIDLSFGLPAVLTGFDKTFLSLTRLTAMFSRSPISSPSFPPSIASPSSMPTTRWRWSAAIPCRSSFSALSWRWSVRCCCS